MNKKREEEDLGKEMQEAGFDVYIPKSKKEALDIFDALCGVKRKKK